ncbi:MAG: GIY-YIG nuclease family protein [bacterium]|nr:GIY-YIG nuclease family protein [bacterium]
MFYTYILKSYKEGSYYIGSCENVDKRLRLHNQGFVTSTKRYKPWQLVYSEKFDNLIGARRREAQIKSLKKRSAVEKLIRTFQNLYIVDPR